jgi:hypothetical protein
MKSIFLIFLVTLFNLWRGLCQVRKRVGCLLQPPWLFSSRSFFFFRAYRAFLKLTALTRSDHRVIVAGSCCAMAERVFRALNSQRKGKSKKKKGKWQAMRAVYWCGSVHPESHLYRAVIGAVSPNLVGLRTPKKHTNTRRRNATTKKSRSKIRLKRSDPLSGVDCIVDTRRSSDQRTPDLKRSDPLYRVDCFVDNIRKPPSKNNRAANKPRNNAQEITIEAYEVVLFRERYFSLAHPR